jgi:hypothetical protein
MGQFPRMKKEALRMAYFSDHFGDWKKFHHIKSQA